MSKKARRKKSRKSTRKSQKFNAEFQRELRQIHEWMAEYEPNSVLFALLTSQIWLPNIASGIRHAAAVLSFASIPDSLPRSERKIDTHEILTDFLHGVWKKIPAFPSVDDFVPDLDWGDVSIRVGSEVVKIFYNGSLERTPDFIESFRIALAGNPVAQAEMDNILRLQDLFIELIPRPEIESLEITAGAVSIPTEEFWVACREAFERVSEAAISPSTHTFLPPLAAPSSWGQVVDRLMGGRLFPAPFLKIAGGNYPVNIRDSAGAVIDKWGAKSTARDQAAPSLRSIASFLRDRFTAPPLYAGPFQLVSKRGGRVPLRIAAFFEEDETLYIFVSVYLEDTRKLDALQRRAQAAVDEGHYWFEIEGRGHAGLARNANREEAKTKVCLVAVFMKSTTAPVRVIAPSPPIRFLFLSDFVSIFDSLDDIREIIPYWRFVDENKHLILMGFLSPTDLFANYRASHGVLVSGAMSPTGVMLDPHSGSNWRFEELRKFWKAAPARFPLGDPRIWRVRETGATFALEARNAQALAYVAQIAYCQLDFVVDGSARHLEKPLGEVLGTLAQCMADSATQRADILNELQFNSAPHVITLFDARPDDRVAGLYGPFEEVVRSGAGGIFRVPVNAKCALDAFTDASDARFEVECWGDWVRGAVAAGICDDPGENWFTRLEATGERPPRFRMWKLPREVDSADGYPPLKPHPRHFKLARKKLALAFSELSISPGRYELLDAKKALSPVIARFRGEVHAAILRVGAQEIAKIALAHFDRLLVSHDQELRLILQSLEHEVDFDRRETVASSNKAFFRESAAYRYLIECSLSLSVLSGESSTDEMIADSDLQEILALIDWLLVIYDADNSLHYDVFAGGLVLDSEYLPEVFYASSGSEEAMETESAREVLKEGVTEGDEAPTLQEEELQSLDRAFFEDLGFSLSSLFAVLQVLSQWQRLNNSIPLANTYAAPADQIERVCLSVSDSDAEQLRAAIKFLTIDPNRIRKLLGSDSETLDVPIWERSKRDHRIILRPLVPDGNAVIWSPAVADRCGRAWRSVLAEGYLPAEFGWPKVSLVLRTAKRRIDRDLENATFQIVQRFVPLVEKNVNLRTRLPKENFADVGDIDVLAYLPKVRTWLIIECKNNKPPFTLKDSRRLRDEMFSEPRGQLAKLHRRVEFFQEHVETFRGVLDWPSPSNSKAERVVSLYVSSRTHYWMKNTPRAVETEFVRISELAEWLGRNFSETSEDC